MSNIYSGFDIPDKLADAQYVQPVYDPDIDTENGIEFGSYKLSKKILDRLMPKKINVNGKIMSNVTPSELILLLSLPSYASSAGTVDCFSIKEGLQYMQPGCICEKSVYNAIKGLADKEYIQIEKTGTGLYTIKINNNDFSQPDRYKDGYINTNRNSFIPGKKQHEIFLNLPLGAKKLYLLLSYNYKKDRGWFRKVEDLKNLLDIKDRSLIYKYLNLLRPLIDEEVYDSIEIDYKASYKGMTTAQRIKIAKEMWAKYKSGNKLQRNTSTSSKELDSAKYWRIKAKTARSKSPVILVRTGLKTLDAKTGIDIDQISYTKRIFSNFIHTYKINFSSHCMMGLTSKNDEINNLFITLKSFSKTLGYEFVKNTILHMLLMYGNVLSANYGANRYLTEQVNRLNKIAK